MEMDFERYTHLQLSSHSLTPYLTNMDRSYSRCHTPILSHDRLTSPETTIHSKFFLSYILQGVLSQWENSTGVQNHTPQSQSSPPLTSPENTKLPNSVFKLLKYGKKSSICNAASNILKIVTGGNKWNQSSQWSWHWNMGTKGFGRHSGAVSKPVSRLLSCIDCQASWISQQFTQGRWNCRHMCLYMSSWGAWLQSHSSMPQVVMMLGELFAHISVCDSAAK